MEQTNTFTELKTASCENTWVVEGIDYSELKDQGIEIINLIDTRDNSKHIAKISNRESADVIDIVFNLDNNDINPLTSTSINIVNAIISYRSIIGTKISDIGLLSSLDLKAFLYVETATIGSDNLLHKPDYISYGTPVNANIPIGSDDRNFSSFLMNSGEHISTLIIGPNENEYYLFDTSDNLHQNTNQTENGTVQADENIYSPDIIDSIICLNKMPMLENYDNAEKSFIIQGVNCCMDWTMMFNAVIHKYKNIDEIIIGRGTEQPFLNPRILEETAKRVYSINKNFIGPEYNEFFKYLKGKFYSYKQILYREKGTNIGRTIG